MSKVLKELFENEEIKIEVEKREPELRLVPEPVLVPEPSPMVSPPEFHPRSNKSSANIIDSSSQLAKVIKFSVLLFLLMVGYQSFILKAKTVNDTLMQVEVVVHSQDSKQFAADFQANREGIQMYQTQNYQDSLSRFEKLLTEYPHSAELMVNMGMAQFKLKDNVSAKKSLLKALKINSALNPENTDTAATIYNNLGSISISDKNFEAAITYLRQALVNSPEKAEAKLNLAVALEQNGKPIEAAGAYEAYIANPAGDPIIKKMLTKRMNKLKSISKYYDQKFIKIKE